MIEVRDLSEKEIDSILKNANYGHLGCSLSDVPYVIPVNYVYLRKKVYLYTTEGRKTDMIDGNPNICLQVEDVQNNSDWRSAVLTGTAERITDPEQREKIVKSFAQTNPTLTPAVSIHWLDDWVRENREVLYLLHINSATGRAAESGGRGYLVSGGPARK